MLELHRPWILLVPPAVAGVLLWLHGRRPRGVTLTGPPDVRLSSRRALVLGVLPALFRGAAVLALATVLAGPHVVRLVRGDSSEGVAIVLVLDVSESMREPGLGSARKLDAAADEVRRFVRGRRGDLMGLVTFAGEAWVRVPPMLDRDALLHAVDQARDDLPENGTALGTALGLAADRLRAVDARSRVIVVLTDGESNAGRLDPLTAARAAAGLGDKVYTIGVGEGAHSDLLGRVAAIGGGRHYGVRDRQGLDRAYREIDSLEPSTFRKASRRTDAPRHAELLWLAVTMVLAESGARAGRYGRIA